MINFRAGLNRLRTCNIAAVAKSVVLALAVLLGVHPCLAGPSPPENLSQTEIMRLGERMYRDGILPSGKAIEASIRGDIAVNSSAFSCSSCHLHAGLGSVEGVVVTPPTTGKILYKPYRRPATLISTVKREGNSKSFIERPAYDRKSLAAAIRSGINPAGQTLSDVMPRYLLSDADIAILISYLETLSSEPSPGASGSEIKFATIITDDVSPEDRQALLQPLLKFVAEKNKQMEAYEEFINFGFYPTVDMQYAFHRASLDIWELKGQPETWSGQLAAYYAKNPVFAVLGGVSNREWKPIHNFCEAQRIPCLFPITEFPVISETSWYTYYFNKGYSQEGDAAARYLNQMKSFPREAPILQIVQDSTIGRALADGFRQGWHELERPDVPTLILTARQLLDQEAMIKILDKHKPEALILWADSEMLPALPKLLPQLSGARIVFMSTSYLGKKTAATPETVRSNVYFTFPYRLTPFVGAKTGGFDAKVPILTSAKDFGDRRITSRTTSMLQQVTLQALNLLYDRLYRDHLMDILGMQMDVTVRDYERLSFGPGQRYVSKGCYIIQLGPGEESALLKRSEWEMR